MRFSIERAELLAALGRVLIAEPTKGDQGSGYVKISAGGQRLMLTTIDPAVCASTHVSISSLAVGDLCVPSKRLLEALKAIPPDRIQLSIQGSMLRLGAGSFRLELGGVDKGVLPNLPEIRSKRSEISFAVVQNLLKKTAYAARADLSHPALAVVCLALKDGRLRADAMDGRRLARAVAKMSGEEMRLLINYKAVYKLLELSVADDACVGVAEGERHLLFELPGSSIFAAKVESDFPGVESAIPAVVSTRVRVRRQELVEALNIAILVEGWGSPGDEELAQLAVESAQLVISSVRGGEQGAARTRLAAEVQGPPCIAALNGVHLRQALREIDADDVELGFGASERPAVIVRSLAKESENLAVLAVRR